MDTLTKNPGLQHIAEEIFLNLSLSDILKCSRVNESWKTILDKPHFWIQKRAQDPKFKNKSAWKKLVQLTSQTCLEKKLTLDLKYDYDNICSKYCPIFWLLNNCGEDSICADIIKKLAPLMENFNNEYSLIGKAAKKGYSDVINVLVLEYPMLNSLLYLLLNS